MPFREYDPTVGFNTYHTDMPNLTPPPEMSGLEQLGHLATVAIAPLEPAIAYAANQRGFNAAFELSNPVVNGIEALTAPQFPVDPTFDILKAVKEHEVPVDMQGAYAGAQSQAEFDYRHQRIQKDQQNQETLASYGAAGQLMNLAAGALDPTMLLPFVGEFKGVEALWQGAKMGALSAGLSEIPLRMNQFERTDAESMSSITMGAIVGSVLGGAAGYLHGKGSTQEKLNEIGSRTAAELGGMKQAEGMAPLPGNEAIPNAEPVALPTSGTIFDAASAKTWARYRPMLDDAIGKADEALNTYTGELPTSLKKMVADLTPDPENPVHQTPSQFIDKVGALNDAIDMFTSNGGKVPEALTKALEDLESTFHGALHLTERGTKSELENFRPTVDAYKKLQGPEVLQSWLDAARDPEAGEAWQRDALDQHAIEQAIREQSVANQNVQPQALGAAPASPVVDAGGLAPAGGAEHILAQTGPVLRVLDQKLNGKLRWIMSQLSDAGALRENREVPSSDSGTVENRNLTYQGLPAEFAYRFDKEYNDYLFDGNVPKFAPNSRAVVGGLLKEGKLSKPEFSKEVSKASYSGDTHTIPHIDRLAKLSRSLITQPLFDEAKALGLFKDLEKNKDGDTSHFSHNYNQKMIAMRREEFVQIGADHINEELQAQFQERFNQLMQKQSKDKLRITDLSRPADEVAALKEEFANDLQGINESSRGTELEDLEVQIANLRAQARSSGLSRGAKDALLDQARELTKQGGDELKEVRSQRAELRRRINSLNKSEVVYGERQSKKLDLVTELEDRNLGTMNRVARNGQKLLNSLDDLSDKELDKQVGELESQLREAGAALDRGQERLSRAYEKADFADEEAVAKIKGAAQLKRQEKFEALADEIDNARGADRDALRAPIQEALDEFNSIANETISNRAKRSVKLEADAAKLDPQLVKARAREIKTRMDVRASGFSDLWRDMSKVDPLTGKADFSDYAKTAASQITTRIQGTLRRLPGYDMLMNPRGLENARLWNIPAAKLISKVDGESFLDLDHERMLHQYVRTLGPDIELYKKLGDFNHDTEKNQHFLDAITEHQAYRETQLAKLQKAGKTQPQIDKAMEKLEKKFNGYLDDVNAVMSRLRYQRGLPTDPFAMSYRSGQVVKQLNSMTRIGGITIKSLSDLGRPILRYALLRTFRDGWAPYIKGLYRPNEIANREMRLAHVGTDTLLQGRLHDVTDIGDYMVRGNRFERAMQWGSGKMGLVTGFDQFTDAIKRVTGLTANAKILDALNAHFGVDNKLTAKQANLFLSEIGLGENGRQLIWNELKEPGGMTMTQSGYWPNTGNWKNPEAIMAYRQALAGQVHDTVMTPGVDRAKMTDASWVHRLIFQFRTFGLSSVPKTVLYGLQKRDAGVLQSVLISLALGAASYYTSARLAGGKMNEEMEKAFQDGSWPEVFADEAIERSGTVGMFADLQDILSKLPLARDYTSISGLHHTLTGEGAAHSTDSTPSGDTLVSSLLGPTADLVFDTANTVTRFHASAKTGEMPWKSTRHHMRRDFLPLQNHFLLRQALDKIGL